jgi:hypothetical protein
MSSKRIIDGAHSSASLNKLEISNEKQLFEVALRQTKVFLPLASKTQFAKVVLPTPGAPWRSNPCGSLIPKLAYLLGLLSWSIILYISFFMAL